MTALREFLPPILVVDDEPDDVELLRHRLVAAKVENPLMAYVNSADALAFLRSLPTAPEAAFLRPCMMFLDINMPRVHGFVFLKWVRTQPELDDVRVVILSGSEKPQDRERAFKLGADQYLVKFPPPEVFAKVIATLTEPAALAG